LLPKNWSEPAIFEKQIEIKLLHSASTEGVTDSGFYLGTDGKRRPATDITVPSNIAESEILQYLDDLCHEWATDRNNCVKQVD
jgi:hypothetical protein